MCGITGYIDSNSQFSENEHQAVITGMMDRITHRGPDDSGIWMDESKQVVLGFRRLAIIDLTPTGHQPMLSHDGRYVIIFNGEIYNFLDIRQELSGLGFSFRGTSDTEVMLAAITAWGIKDALKKFNGMFAFALWDRREKALTLARDRLGIKPLYYGWHHRLFLFGSELKCLTANPVFHGEINRDALCLYLRHNYIPAPYTVYKGIHKLEPGAFLTIFPTSDGQPLVTEPYWVFNDVVENGVLSRFRGDEKEAVDQLEKLLMDSVKQRMVADVPLGAFLSGGIDSSTIVALMQAQTSIPVKTFTIGFQEKGYNEAGFAREVAAYLKTDHTELYVTPSEARAVIPDLPGIYDEPFSDVSQIPTCLISRLARKDVTVCLSGDGGDELFFGYERYFWMDKWAHLSSVNKTLNRLGSLVFRACGSEDNAWVWNGPGRFIPQGKARRLRERMNKLSILLENPRPEWVYKDFVSHWKNPESVIRGGQEPTSILMNKCLWPQINSINEMMIYLDTKTYLTDDVLVKVDRASMSASLETRAPLLDDHRLIEFAWTLPMDYKYRDNKGKWILRQVLYRHVPRMLIERPKMGFAVPIDSWLRGPLKDWAGDLLDDDLLKKQGFFNPQPIREKWAEHLSGQNDWQYYLWDILMFQSWLETNHIS